MSPTAAITGSPPDVEPQALGASRAPTSIARKTTPPARRHIVRAIAQHPPWGRKPADAALILSVDLTGFRVDRDVAAAVPGHGLLLGRESRERVCRGRRGLGHHRHPRQYQRPRAKPPNAISPIRATMMPRIRLQKIAITIPTMTRIPPTLIPVFIRSSPFPLGVTRANTPKGRQRQTPAGRCRPGGEPRAGSGALATGLRRPAPARRRLRRAAALPPSPSWPRCGAQRSCAGRQPIAACPLLPTALERPDQGGHVLAGTLAAPSGGSNTTLGARSAGGEAPQHAPAARSADRGSGTSSSRGHRIAG